MEEYKENIVAVRFADNAKFDLTVTIMEDDVFTMSVLLDNQLYKVNADDIFPTFQKLRDILLNNDIGLKCCGAMINAHQSGMMTTSDKVYLLTFGKPALRKDIATIFDYADIKEFPNTLEQEKFAQAWINSLISGNIINKKS